MHKRWDKHKCHQRTLELLDEQLFFDMYETLASIAQEFGEPCPAELWDEAASRWKPLLSNSRAEIAVQMLKAELEDEYGERSAFLIMMIMMYMLTAMFRPDEKSPYRKFCQAIANATKDHPLLNRLWSGVRRKEDEEELEGKKIGIVVSLLSEMKASEQSIDFDTIEKCIMRLPSFDLQYKALQDLNAVLIGTSWSSKAEAILNQMIDKQNRQQARQDDLADNINRNLSRSNVVYQSGAIHYDCSKTMNMNQEHDGQKMIEKKDEQ